MIVPLTRSAPLGQYRSPAEPALSALWRGGCGPATWLGPAEDCRVEAEGTGASETAFMSPTHLIRLTVVVLLLPMIKERGKTACVYQYARIDRNVWRGGVKQSANKRLQILFDTAGKVDDITLSAMERN